MKKNLLKVLLLSLVAIFISCNKDDDSDDDKTNPTPTTQTYCKLLDFTESSNSKSMDYYTLYYDEMDRLVKLTEADSIQTNITEYDTVIYGSNNEIDKIKRYEYDWFNQQFELDETYTYTYTEDKITQIVETGESNGSSYTTTYTYTYNGDNLVSMTSVGEEIDGPAGFKDIVYVNGNISTLKMDVLGNGSIFVDLTITCDDKNNYNNHLLPYPDRMIDLVNSNNFISVTTLDSIPIEEGFILPGTKILERTYSYNEHGEVITINEAPSPFDSDSRSRTIQANYDCVKE